MFRSLLQTIPTISGNFTLACKLNNYTQNSKYEYTSYINDAILMPLDNNYNLTKDIKINLINGKYEYDIMKYFKEISSYFYDDTYLKNNNIFELYDINKIYNLPDNRDKNFEFGCKRISYNKYQYQFQFYAPIYVNNFDDLPDEFVIEIYYNSYVAKKIHIPINKSLAKNKLRIYLKKFIEKITNNIPIIWNFNDNKIIYKNVIDCKNGGLISFTSYNTIQSNNVYQTIINDIDNLICQNYSQNNIILSECIPLSFIFNINDLISNKDKYYYHLNQFNIAGYYTKNGNKCSYYNFSTNYHSNYQSYTSFNNYTNDITNVSFNLFDNDIIYSLHEGTNEKLYYQNTFKNKYCQWKLNESDSYIINLNSVFTYNTLENKFPVFKNTLGIQPKTLFKDSTLYLPITNFVNIFSNIDQNQYALLQNNNYCDWFNTYNQYDIDNYLKTFKKVCNNYTFINGIKYYISDSNIKYFNIFVKPNVIKYDENIILGNVILDKKESDNITYYEYNKNENNLFYTLYNISDDDPDDLPVYIKYDNYNVKYIEYSENIFNTIFNTYYINNNSSTNSFYIHQTVKELFNNIIKSIRKFDDDQELEQYYKMKYENIFNKYFSEKNGYKLIDIDITQLTKTFILNIFSINKNYRDLIYFSLPNIEEKTNLYYALLNNKIDFDYLQMNNATLFIKSSFIEVNNVNQFYINLFSKNGLYTDIENQYTINETTLNAVQTAINELIINYKNFIYNNSTESFTDLLSLKSTKFKNLFTISKDIIDNNIGNNGYYIPNMFINLYNLVNELIDITIYIIIYHGLSQYINDDNVSWYKYIPCYNDNDILINSNYYQQIYNHKNFATLYTNIIQNTNTKEIYTHITNSDTYVYYMNNIITTDNISNILYHKEEYIDVFSKKYKLIDIKTYINNYIINNILINDNQIKYIYDEQTEINETNLNMTDIYKLFNHNLNISFSSNQCILEIICTVINGKNNTITNTTYKIPINLYIKSTAYELSSTFDQLDLTSDNVKNNPIMIFKETALNEKNDTANYTLTEIIYNDHSTNKKFEFAFNKLLKNFKKYQNSNNGNITYVYEDPYNYLIKMTKRNYNDYYRLFNKNVYIKNDNINKYSYEYININDNAAYLVITYNLLLSTNSFNIYDIDSNDNFEITTINNTPVVDSENNIIENSIISMFKNIYPYLKQDILLHIVSYINNDTNIPIQFILPNTIKCNINTIVNKKLDNTKFTEIKKSDNIIKKIYLNRYFGNISPYFIETNKIINNVRSKIYIINDNIINTNILSNSNNANTENINIYKYNNISYYKSNKDTDLLFTKQIEYKHFNNNYLFNLPNELIIPLYNIDYIPNKDLHIYINSDMCYKYFCNYLQKNYSNFKYINDENLFLYIFNKYSIEYIQESTFINVLTKAYTITYKLTLL